MISKLSIRPCSIAVWTARLTLLPITKIFLFRDCAVVIIVFSLAIFEEKQVTTILPFSSLNILSKLFTNSDSDLEEVVTLAFVESPTNKSNC